MEPPERLPRSADELAAWSVYADWLQGSADVRARRHGALIAFDLRFGADATPIELERYRAFAGHYCNVSMIGWSLGFARGIHVGWHSVEEVTVLLRSPLCRFLEEIELETCKYTGPWRALLEAIPATCVRAVLRQAGPSYGDVHEALPPQIVELGTRSYRGRTVDRGTRFVATYRATVREAGLLPWAVQRS